MALNIEKRKINPHKTCVFCLTNKRFYATLRLVEYKTFLRGW
jgi:hypothetical protein